MIVEPAIGPNPDHAATPALLSVRTLFKTPVVAGSCVPPIVIVPVAESVPLIDVSPAIATAPVVALTLILEVPFVIMFTSFASNVPICAAFANLFPPFNKVAGLTRVADAMTYEIPTAAVTAIALATKGETTSAVDINDLYVSDLHKN